MKSSDAKAKDSKASESLEKEFLQGLWWRCSCTSKR